ncbi:MAG TPA: YhbY family RNA-binding protein [Thermoanaerobaculia bacterium]|nr:YhbY family RNA-binding protein [Thermoanaerobaculia bacterium]
MRERDDPGGGPLSGRQRRWLRARAHGLDPVVSIGGKGLTEAVVAEADRALDAHELIKVRLVGDRDEREATAAELAERLSAEALGIVGRVAMLYRRHREPERRRVRPPSR